jgi:hypothetical protein
MANIANRTPMTTRGLDTAVVQTPYPPADLNARGVQRRGGKSACKINQQHVRDN